jgi:hypothetical protein
MKFQVSAEREAAPTTTTTEKAEGDETPAPPAQVTWPFRQINYNTGVVEGQSVSKSRRELLGFNTHCVICCVLQR